MNESIYNLVPHEQIVQERKPIVRSEYHQSSVPGSTFGCTGTTRLYGAGKVVKKDGALFGPPKEGYGLPRTISPKSNTATSGSGKFSYTDHRKANIPSKDEKPIMGITTSKNFVTANAVEAILQAPKPTANTDLNYMKKEDFGKVPAYLAQVKDEIRRENEMIERYVKEQMGEVEAPPEVFEEFPEEERAELLTALKAKWDNVNAQYQKITHLVKLDTTGQVRRKELLENQLQQLENDIGKLERPLLIHK